MHKVKVWNDHFGVVIEDGKEVKRTCRRGEDVYLPELNMDDIKNCLYIPYKVKIVGTDGKPMVRQRVEPKTTAQSVPASGNKTVAEVALMADSVTDSIKNLLGEPTEVNESGTISPEGVPDDMCIEEGQEVLAPFSREDYLNQQNQMHNAVVNSMSEGIGKERQVLKVSTPKPKMPVFAQDAPNSPIILGELNVAAQSKMPGEKDIFDNRPVIVDIVKDSKGEIDVVKSLGLKVVNAGDAL